ncbi:hypothetical protein LZ906_016080 (plasmid) [Paraclostridium ghonii]|uniref:hypothetical protein n=1 Tax=Paraclostridium ghonii TaxID=29358 RepID=UPI00202CAD44|nr:hypothetical protein [Paeniclostridium ghonii]MCM0165106.1 hypothetical protein [Paeniclostridium ghonii]
MNQLSKDEKLIILGYIDEMLEIFNTVLSEEFEDDEDPSIICDGKKFLKKDFESLKIKIQNLE